MKLATTNQPSGLSSIDGEPLLNVVVPLAADLSPALQPEASSSSSVLPRKRDDPPDPDDDDWEDDEEEAPPGGEDGNPDPPKE